MGLLSGGRSDDEDLLELEDEEDEDQDDEDDVAPRSKKKAAPAESTAARVRALIDAGATSKATLVEDLGDDASHRIDVQLAHMTKRGEIERTGRGTFKKIGGGQSACRSAACEAREGREGRDVQGRRRVARVELGTLHAACRGRGDRLRDGGRRCRDRPRSREVVT